MRFRKQRIATKIKTIFVVRLFNENIIYNNKNEYTISNFAIIFLFVLNILSHSIINKTQAIKNATQARSVCSTFRQSN